MTAQLLRVAQLKGLLRQADTAAHESPDVLTTP
ncbi:hypothetical protein MSG_00082 [Mycobacterium shigaense]|uniref:Uncharacterized protein n=1 Tax=Mycobacterium shigaense TaxID=722731 RepID=A0A1Z4EBA9_9MYCO|nr:hypothetical protein MSG_00082 [Mycobacterium shigaense]